MYDEASEMEYYHLLEKQRDTEKFKVVHRILSVEKHAPVTINAVAVYAFAIADINIHESSASIDGKPIADIVTEKLQLGTGPRFIEPLSIPYARYEIKGDKAIYRIDNISLDILLHSNGIITVLGAPIEVRHNHIKYAYADLYNESASDQSIRSFKFVFDKRRLKQFRRGLTSIPFALFIDPELLMNDIVWDTVIPYFEAKYNIIWGLREDV